MHPNELERLKAWIGRTERREDVLTQRLVAELCATLTLPAPVEPVSAPITLHWCLAPEIERGEKLGSDGHPALGHFLPPVPLARRMWVGGEFTLHTPLHVDDRVIRTSRISDIELKTGRTGALCFVTVAHEMSGARGLAVSERQVLVYRDSLVNWKNRLRRFFGHELRFRPQKARLLRPAQWQDKVTIDPVMLFRYSALTFNGHRIHYDVDYCRRAGLDGLLVHGPLQASLLAEFAASIWRGRAPTHFSYRAVRPLIASDAPLTLNAVETDSGLDLWAATPAGLETMTASARWGDCSSAVRSA